LVDLGSARNARCFFDVKPLSLLAYGCGERVGWKALRGQHKCAIVSTWLSTKVCACIIKSHRHASSSLAPGARRGPQEAIEGSCAIIFYFFWGGSTGVNGFLTDFLKTSPYQRTANVHILPFVIAPHSPTSASGTVDMGTRRGVLANTMRTVLPFLFLENVLRQFQQRLCDLPSLTKPKVVWTIFSYGHLS
jgi:hypothetical protein